MDILPVIHLRQYDSGNLGSLFASAGQFAKNIVNDFYGRHFLQLQTPHLDHDCFWHAAFFEEGSDVLPVPEHIADRDGQEICDVLRQSHSWSKSCKVVEAPGPSWSGNLLIICSVSTLNKAVKI